MDASAVIAASDRRDPRHRLAQAALTTANERLLIPAPVTTEIDYLLERRVGLAARLSFYTDVQEGRFEVETLVAEEHGEARVLQERYADLNLGLADLSIVILAARFNTRRILTFDFRHFRAIRPLQGGQFVLLPDDE